MNAEFAIDPTIEEVMTAVIYDYEQVLISGKRTISGFYFEDQSEKTSEAIACTLIRYVSERYWGWSPQKLRDSINSSLLKKWKLSGVLKHISFPDGLSERKDLWYIAHKVYPKELPINERDLCLSLYQKVLSGEIKRFPKGYFSEFTGMNRACYCVSYAIDHFTNFTSVEELYAFFGTTACIGFLRKYGLRDAIKELFDAPIVPIHLIAPPSQERTFLLNYYRLWYIFGENARVETDARGAKRKKEYRKINKEDTAYAETEY